MTGADGEYHGGSRVRVNAAPHKSVSAPLRQGAKICRAKRDNGRKSRIMIEPSNSETAWAGNIGVLYAKQKTTPLLLQEVAIYISTDLNYENPFVLSITSCYIKSSLHKGF